MEFGKIIVFFHVVFNYGFPSSKGHIYQFFTYLSQYAGIPRMYIEESMVNTKDEFDHILSVTHDYLTESYKIGDSRINFENSTHPNNLRNTLAGPDFSAKGIYYFGTPGLSESLFKKQPVGFKEEDVNNYVDILKRTNALYIDNDPTKRKKTVPRDIRDICSLYNQNWQLDFEQVPCQ